MESLGRDMPLDRRERLVVRVDCDAIDYVEYQIKAREGSGARKDAGQ